MISGSLSRLPDPVYPLGASVVGTALGAAGHRVEWFDALRHDRDPGTALEQRLAEEEPDVVMMSIRNIDSAAFPGVHRHFEEHLDLARACKRWGCAPESIIGFIKSGELRAFNVAAKGTTRPRWRITEEAIREFERRRAAVPVKPAQKKRRPREATAYF